MTEREKKLAELRAACERANWNGRATAEEKARVRRIESELRNLKD